jgi:ABC-type sugar transport system permease subunit
MTILMWLWRLKRERGCLKLNADTLKVEEMLVNWLNKNKLARLLLLWWDITDELYDQPAD